MLGSSALKTRPISDCVVHRQKGDLGILISLQSDEVAHMLGRKQIHRRAAITVPYSRMEMNRETKHDLLAMRTSETNACPI